MMRRTTAKHALRRAADPRVVGGVVVMAASAFVGLAMMSAGDEVALVAVATRDLPAGVDIQEDDFALREVVLEQPQKYVRNPDFAGRLAVPIGAGELIPRSAVEQEKPRTRLVALPIEVDRLPPDVQRGSKVDVWRVDAGPEDPVLVRADVVGVTSPDQWSGASATVVLSVDEEDVGDLLSATRAGPVDITAYQGVR